MKRRPQPRTGGVNGSTARTPALAQCVSTDVTAPGGIVMVASCSHNIPPERFAAECAAGLSRTGRRAALIRQSGAGIDHPVHPLLPESAYLKALFYALD